MQRNKHFLLGFVSASSFFVFTALAPVSVKYESTREIAAEFQNVLQAMQPRQYEVRDSTPQALSAIRDSEVIMVSTAAGHLNLFSRYKEQIFRVDFSSK